MCCVRHEALRDLESPVHRSLGTQDLSGIDELDDEICLGLRVETSYTGGSLKWMGVVAPHVQQDPYVDYMNVIEGFSRDELARFVSLADDPSIFDLDRVDSYRFGDETDHPLNVRQMMFLKYRYGVYFPWKVAFHFVENDRWEDKIRATEGHEPGGSRALSKTLRVHSASAVQRDRASFDLWSPGQ
ncbi:MAG: hypothetical protein U0165_18600 [Polyangiaceae bacterium]